MSESNERSRLRPRFGPWLLLGSATALAIIVPRSDRLTKLWLFSEPPRPLFLNYYDEERRQWGPYFVIADGTGDTAVVDFEWNAAIVFKELLTPKPYGKRTNGHIARYPDHVILKAFDLERRFVPRRNTVAFFDGSLRVIEKPLPEGTTRQIQYGLMSINQAGQDNFASEMTNLNSAKSVR
ncbi:MAG: hypothetical protein AAF532_12815 [Planctomycetota bacterium]